MNTDKIYVESVINEYSKKDTKKEVTLKDIDRKVKLPPKIFCYALGIVSILLFGLGMCLAMHVIEDGYIERRLLGFLFFLIGTIFMLVNSTIYKSMLNHRKKKYSKEILELESNIYNK